MAVTLLKGQAFNGISYPAFHVLAGLGADAEARLVQGGDAKQVNLQVVLNTVDNGAWRPIPGVVMRLRMAGAGTVSMDSRNGAGTVSTAVYSRTVTGTQVVDFAYPGDDADSIRINLTGSATAEVI